MTSKLFPSAFDFARGIFLHGLNYNLTSNRGEVIAGNLTTVILYNPQAGRLKGGGHKGLESAARILRDGGRNVILAPTTGPGTAGDIARRWIGDGAAMVVAAGGDTA